MRFGILILLFCAAVVAKEKDSFITEKEYAQHLYENPRGIGCNKCHGKKGEGMVISTYKHKGVSKVLATKPINSLSFKEFEAALEEKRSVMPKYFLTVKEIKALYNYLHHQK
jgi:hypothetical protein